MSFLKVLDLFEVLEFASKRKFLRAELVECGKSEKVYWFDGGRLLAPLDSDTFAVVQTSGPLERVARERLGNLVEKGVGEDYVGAFRGMVQIVRFGNNVYAFFQPSGETAVIVKVVEIEL